MDTNKILHTRQASHGDYRENATVSQDLKNTIQEFKYRLDYDQAESLDLICTKIGRILTGNPDEPDHWLDIAGYATLVYNRLMEGTDVVGRDECHTVLHTDGGDTYNTHSLDLDKLSDSKDPMGGL